MDLCQNIKGITAWTAWIGHCDPDSLPSDILCCMALLGQDKGAKQTFKKLCLLLKN